LYGFNPTSARVDIAVLNVTMFSFGFTLGDVGGTSKLCHTCVIRVYKRLRASGKFERCLECDWMRLANITLLKTNTEPLHSPLIKVRLISTVRNHVKIHCWADSDNLKYKKKM